MRQAARGATHAAGAEEPSPSAESPLDPLLRNIEKLAAEVGHVLSVRADMAWLRARSAASRLGITVAVLVAEAALVVAGIAELASGISGGLADVFGSRWMGEIAGGTVLLAAVVIYATLKGRGAARRRRDALVARYEARRAARSRRFDHDLAHRNGGGVRA